VKLISVAGAKTDAVTYVLDGGTHNQPYVNSAMPLPFPDALQEFKVETSAAPALGTYRNMASQSIQGPGSVDFDVALARLFRINERLNIQVRAEAFNVMNHVNSGNTTTPSSGATSGASSPAALMSGVDVTLSDPLFGKIVNAADPRIMQVAIKLNF
jgi:hypothetical protein